MASLFISYSRKDIGFAKKLTESFKSQELDFWIDWEGIPPTVDWWKEIEKGIEEANIFLFLISPDSVISPVCRKEIEHAAKNGKRLIPLIVRDIKAEESPAELRSLNWIFVRENDDFEMGFNKIITAIKTDYVWVQTHRQLQVKALEWTRSNRENSFLLRGKELQDAEFQLATNTSKEPNPTDAQREYVFVSRKAIDQQRKNSTVITIAVAIITSLLAAAAVWQANLANQRATRARAGELAAQSVSLRGSQFDLALLFSIEAFRTADLPRTRSILLESTQAKPELSQYLRGPTDWVRSLAFSPDGKTLAAGTDDNAILLWDVASRQRIGEPLTGHTNYVWTIAFNPDGKMLASGSWDANIILWDVATQQPIGQPLRGHTESINSVAFSPDGRMLASSSDDGIAILWDVADHQPIGKPITNPGGIYGITFSPDGKMLAAGDCGDIDSEQGFCSAGDVILWDVATRQPIGQPFTGHFDFVNSVAFSSDGTMLASGSDDNYVFLWDVATRQLLGWHREHTNDVSKVVFSPDGKTLISSSFDNSIILWDVATRSVIDQPLTGHNDLISIAISPDEGILASGGTDQSIILWNLSSPPRIGQRLTERKDWVRSVAFSPDGKILASGSCGSIDGEGLCSQGEVILWDMATRQPIGEPLTEHTDYINSVAFSPDGKILASGSADHTIILWDVPTGTPIGKPLTQHTDWINSLVFSPDGKILASGSSDKTIILWDVAKQQSIGQPLKGSADSRFDDVYSLAFSPDGKILASGIDFNIILWDIATGEPSGQPFTGHSGSVSDVTFSPDGKTLASASADGTSMLWDVATRQPIGKPLRGYETTVSATSVAFSPDGKTLASASRTASLWDLETQPLVEQPLIGQTDLVTSVAFSPDGRILASGSSDHTIILWNLDVLSWIEVNCQRVARNFTRAEWAQYFPGEEYRATCPDLPLDPEPSITAIPTP